MNTHIIQKIENCLYCLLYSVVSVCCSQAVALRKGGVGHCGGNTASPGGSREGGEDRFSLLRRQLTTVITT